jgi:hydroxymethylglutaryl-CoA lyase
MSAASRVTIVEVGPRDGLQLEKSFVPTARKLELINALMRAGIRRMEVTSFVSPKVMPQLSDAAEVMAGIERVAGGVCVALVPNLKGTERALACGADSVKIVICTSDTYNRRNVGMSVEDSLKSCAEVLAAARQAGKIAEVVIGLSFGCPLEGPVPEDKVIALAGRVAEMGYAEISIADSMGLANPGQVRRMMRRLRREFPQAHFSLHLHDTRGLGLANVLVAWEEGIDMFDASVGGLGGSAVVVAGATGNITTEDLVNMFHEMGVETGVDMGKLQGAARLAQEIIGRPLPSHILNNGTPAQFYQRVREDETRKAAQRS